MENDDLSVTIIRDALEEGIDITDDIKKLARKYEADKKEKLSYKLRRAFEDWLEGKVIPMFIGLCTTGLGALMVWLAKVFDFIKM